MLFFFYWKVGIFMENNRPQWTSYVSFLIATIGSAVGLGNIWRFPYIMGKNGGAVFLFTYLAIIAFVCIIPLCVELAIGKTYRGDAITCLEKINPKFSWLGYLCLLTVIIIPCFYFVVCGWILNYIWLYLINSVPTDFSLYFPQLNSNPYVPIILTWLFLFLASIFPFRGLNNGVEKANNIMMPLFAVMLIILAVYACTLSGTKEGLEFMFLPDFSKFSKTTILSALGQALFTLSVGMGAMITYGSYLKKEVNIKRSAYTLIFFDTIVALLAGIMIFPIVFSSGIEPTAGPTLVFISLPQIFSNLPCSNLLALIFFFLLFFAAITSAISMMETAVSSFIDKFNMSRQKATFILSVIIAFLSIPAALSFGPLADFKVFDMTFFDLFDHITSNILLPFNTLIISIIGGWFAHNVSKEAFGETFFGKVLIFLLRFVVPFALICGLVLGF